MNNYLKNRVMQFMKTYLWIIFFLIFLHHVASMTNTTGSNLTGSSEFARLGQSFTWTCVILVPVTKSSSGLIFLRNTEDIMAILGFVNTKCEVQAPDPRYRYDCLSQLEFTLTIPGENMTEYEQGSMWKCQYKIDKIVYENPLVSLQIAIDVHNVSLIPSAKPLTIRENKTKEVLCAVNSNAVPAPTINWYLESTDITTMAGINKTYIVITGDRLNNTKILQCRASNNNIKPQMTANTTLNIEYPPTVPFLGKRDIVEGKNLSVTCKPTPGNPSSTTIYWARLDNLYIFSENETTLHIPDIQRSKSGTYRCSAETIFSDMEKGTHSQNLVVNVLYPPKQIPLLQQNIIEGQNLSVICNVTPGNPISTTFYWTKVDNPEFRQNGSALQLQDIQRTSSGTYNCTAQNTLTNGEFGTDNQIMVVNVQYPPKVNNFSQRTVIEGTDVTVNCDFIPGNPNSTTLFWKRRGNNTGFIKNGAILHLPKIKRTSSGIYACIAQNNFSNGMNGTHNQSLFIDVQYQPTIENKQQQIINESEKVTLTRDIFSNPLSIVSWYDKTNLLLEQTSVTTATLTIQRASCTDTKNFTLVASNGIGTAAKAMVELIVNCKPVPVTTNITLGVTDSTGIKFSVTVIAYPDPWYELKNENGTKNIQMMDNTIIRNSVNNFSINFNQTVVKKDDYGTYFLQIGNRFGVTTVQINVLPQSRPDEPRQILATCEITAARVQWISSFDGGDSQTFTVFALNSQYETRNSDPTSDTGENIVHAAYVQNLQPSVSYVFYVFAQNRHGNSSSENFTCTTLKKDTGDNLPLITGGAVAGGVTLAIIVLVAIILLRRQMQIEKSAKHVERLNDVNENEENDADVDGMKENSLYVSAGPKDDEKPEAVVYAAVAKKIPQSNNNSNLYADVKKSGRQVAIKGAMSLDVKPKRGVFKKDEKTKHKKGKKPKNRPGETDVYENSEDIALSTNVDNMYSNAGQKGPNIQEERGYKNKDGLLYVEVNFDGKKGHDNPVIHGEDEKTDYATVEFPMPSSLQKASGSEKF